MPMTTFNLILRKAHCLNFVQNPTCNTFGHTQSISFFWSYCEGQTKIFGLSETCWYVRKVGVDNRDLSLPAKWFLKLSQAKFCGVDPVVPNHRGRPLANDEAVHACSPAPCAGGFSSITARPRPRRVPALPPLPAAEEVHCVRGAAPAPPTDVSGALCKFPVMPSILGKIGR